MKHTKETWNVGFSKGDYAIGNEQGAICILPTTYKNNTEPKEAEANAKLIAAAPILLEALAMLKDSFIHSDKENIKGNKAKTDMIKYNDEVKDALNAARIAIQRATE